MIVSSPSIIGNFRIEPGERTVSIRLIADANGCAIFGYDELPKLAEHLKSLSPPSKIGWDKAAVEDDMSDIL